MLKERRENHLKKMRGEKVLLVKDVKVDEETCSTELAGDTVILLLCRAETQA